MVTGQLADKPTRGQSSRGLVNSRTTQLAEMFDLKFAVYNSSKLLLLLILGTASTRRVSSFACRCHRNTVVANSKVFSLSLKSTLGVIMHWKNIFLVFEIFLTASVLSA